MGDLSKEKIDAIRSQYNKRNSRGSLARQKIRLEYLQVYPWIQVDEQDPHFVFCRFCECRLTAKSSDFPKHEVSLKHREKIGLKLESGAPNLQTAFSPQSQFEEYINVGEDRIKLEEDIKMEQKIDLTDDSSELIPNSQNAEMGNEMYDDMYDDESSGDSASATVHSKYIPKITLTTLNSLTSPGNNQPGISPNNMNTGTPSPCKITIKKVDVPPSTLANSMRTSSSVTPMLPAIGNLPYPIGCQQPFGNGLSPNALLQHMSPANQIVGSSRSLGNSPYDLFFQSICETVKSFPPRLALEGKLRIMQLVGELEEKAIAERENNIE